jgi:methionine biosynthesis protein MetW
MGSTNLSAHALRYDLQIVASWIDEGAKVLGLGCGEGDLLHYLKTHKRGRCTGIEIEETKVARCIERGLTVIKGDINEEVLDYAENSFDVVVLSQTLQQIYDPLNLIETILRIGRRAVVSFPNFSHWNIRFQLLMTGHAPKSVQLPYEWYNTPNIRVITLSDFKRFAKQIGFHIYKEVAIRTHSQDYHGKIVRFLPNWRATYGLYLIGR